MSDKISGRRGGGALREFNLGGNLNLLILIATQLIQIFIRGLTFYLHSLDLVKKLHRPEFIFVNWKPELIKLKIKVFETKF